MSIELLALNRIFWRVISLGMILSICDVVTHIILIGLVQGYRDAYLRLQFNWTRANSHNRDGASGQASQVMYYIN